MVVPDHSEILIYLSWNGTSCPNVVTELTEWTHRSPV